MYPCMATGNARPSVLYFLLMETSPGLLTQTEYSFPWPLTASQSNPRETISATRSKTEILTVILSNGTKKSKVKAAGEALPKLSEINDRTKYVLCVHSTNTTAHSANDALAPG